MRFAIRLIFGLIFETGLATTYMVIASLVKEWLNQKNNTSESSTANAVFCAILFYGCLYFNFSD
ncbi:hypothetical protein LPAF129_08750 [Ligilactobacillus pabuli]|uniref:Uncharacterized protein n=1 Tax=Ligilactobacillus pabuli TaxID=2886039 RepID=A0ABQ5JGJ0_9LACO|nr:hypothetical protein [Ligilactobacillus pabuli]GKS81189.1 hypothetical protein LPAF129_08750 [Ligilactobacillus pabuli]